MRVLVAFATRSGSTGEIAERIAQRLRTGGHDADAEPVSDAVHVTAYDAFVIGSAVYLGRWQKEAVRFVQRNRSTLADRPTWLFSSGPLGTEPTLAGIDQRDGAVNPAELAALTEAARPRGHHVFFGALNPDHLGLGPRVMRLTPAGRKLFVEGDFRDWTEIEAWTDEIAGALTATRMPAGAEA